MWYHIIKRYGSIEPSGSNLTMRPVGFYFLVDPVVSSVLLVESQFKLCCFTEFVVILDWVDGWCYWVPSGSIGIDSAGSLIHRTLRFLRMHWLYVKIEVWILWLHWALWFHQTGRTYCSIGPSGTIGSSSSLTLSTRDPVAPSHPEVPSDPVVSWDPVIPSDSEVY